MSSISNREAVEAIVLTGVDSEWKLDTVYMDPSSLQTNEVIVDIVASGLCHSDLSWANGTIPRDWPSVLGHEGVGYCRQVGPGVKSCKKGDKVLLSWAYCRTGCGRCKTGHPAQCSTWDKFNNGGMRQEDKATYTTRDGKVVSAACLGTSTFARAVIVDESSVVNLGDTKADLATLAPLGCGLITGAGAVLNVARPQPGDAIVVFGFGAVGAGAVMAAKLTPASTIIAVDLQQSRLDLAKQYGATHTVNATETKDVVKAIKDLTGDLGVEYAIECTGVPAVLKQAYEALATGGAVVLLGIPHYTSEFSFNILELLRFQRRIIGCVEGDCTPELLVPILMQHWANGRFPFDLLNRMYNFKDAAQALEDMKSGRVVKPILVWDL